MDEPRRIPELIILPSSFDRKFTQSNLKSCCDCNSNLFYVEEEYGIVKEDNWYGIMGNKSNRTYEIRIVALNLFCSKCGSFVENYFKLYDDKDIVYVFDRDIDEDEKIGIEYCLSQFNQKRDFIPGYNFAELNVIKSKLLEFEKKYPETNKLNKIKKNKKKGKKE